MDDFVCVRCRAKCKPTLTGIHLAERVHQVRLVSDRWRSRWRRRLIARLVTGAIHKHVVDSAVLIAVGSERLAGRGGIVVRVEVVRAIEDARRVKDHVVEGAQIVHEARIDDLVESGQRRELSASAALLQEGIAEYGDLTEQPDQMESLLSFVGGSGRFVVLDGRVDHLVQQSSHVRVEHVSVDGRGCVLHLGREFGQGIDDGIEAFRVGGHFLQQLPGLLPTHTIHHWVWKSFNSR